jgi:hypothetical protein
VERTGDAVADVLVLGWASYVNATTNPNLYRAMFMDGPCDAAGAKVGLDTFERLVDGVRRCIASDRLDPADPVERATQLWAAAHGAVSLQLAGMLAEDLARDCVLTTARNLLQAFGDTPSALGRSVARAESRLADVPSPR